MARQKVLIIVGPTASGKSALGVHLARTFDGEIISADSRQVYRGLDIGTGKITRKEMRGVRHHLLDLRSPKKAFSAGDYVKKARSVIAQMKKLPIITGGTGFYIDALVGRIALPEVAPNPALRKRLQNKSATQLYAALEKKDPARAALMDTPSERNNKARLIRALEIAHSSKKGTMWEIVSPTYDILWIGINPPFAKLEQKIKERLVARVRKGMISEAKRLHAKGLSYKRMEELGLEYRSLARYLQGRITKEEMTEELTRDIRRYAKKQLRYWKRNPDIKWFRPTQKSEIEKTIGAWLEK